MKGAKEDKMSYAEAIAEVERILEGFNDRQVDVDELADRLRRATELIKLCRAKLRKAEEDVAKILQEE